MKKIHKILSTIFFSNGDCLEMETYPNQSLYPNAPKITDKIHLVHQLNCPKFGIKF